MLLQNIKVNVFSHFLTTTVIKNTNDASVMSRAFACIADVLGCKAENQGGLRSGPAANSLWKKGLTLLEVLCQIDNIKSLPSPLI